LPGFIVDIVDLDAGVVEAARAQGGLVTTRQLADLGMSRYAVDVAVAEGALERRRRGQLVVPEVNSDEVWALRVRELVVAAGPGAAAGGETAARLQSIAGTPTVARIVIVVPADRHPVAPPGVRIVRAPVATTDLGDVDGIPVTAPLRTLVDCARRSDRVVATCLLESAARQELVTIAEVTQRVAALSPRTPGVRNARRALASVDLRSESPLETLTRLLLLDAGLPYPDLQTPFALPEASGWIDLSYPREFLGLPPERYRGLAIEADGREPHLRAEMFHHDRVRHTALEEDDWLVRRFTDVHLRTRPAYVVAAVRRGMSRVAPELDL
jgi:predicted transcriptional regulator of viral defense system